MMILLSVLYGIFIAALIYFFAFLSARTLFGKRGIPLFVTIFKYLIYWKIISFGFNHLLTWGILVGFTAGLYLSLPILYFLNKQFTHTKNQDIEIHLDCLFVHVG